MEKRKLNLGCGNDYKKGFINVDFNKEIKADVYCDLTKKLPFKDDYADLVYMDNSLEHIPSDKYFSFLQELHRICKPNAKIIIYVPHYSGMYAFRHPTHYKFFGIGSFDIFSPKKGFAGERYSKVRFITKEERLLFFHHNLFKLRFFSKLPINWMFNFNRTWQLIMERFNFFGYDEILYVLRTVK
jgi:SAM-dependent methyltransferase